jgi:hypothetical protein
LHAAPSFVHSHAIRLHAPAARNSRKGWIEPVFNDPGHAIGFLLGLQIAVLPAALMLATLTREYIEEPGRL